MRAGKCLLAALLLLLATGCWNMRELEHQYYANAFAVDWKDGQYEVYVQVIDFSVLGKQEGKAGSTSVAGAWVGKGRGATYDSAIHNLYAVAERKIYWGHVNAIIVGEKVLKQGLGAMLDILTRYNEFRYTMWIFGTKDPPEELLLASPVIEMSPVYSQLSTPEDVYEQSSFIPPMRMHRLIASLREPGRTALLPAITLSKKQWKDNEKTYKVLQNDGTFLLKNEKMQGWMPKTEVLGVRWLEKETNRTPLIVPADADPDAVLIVVRPKPRVQAEVRNGKPFFHVKVKVEASVIELMRRVPEKTLVSEAKKRIEEEIRKTFKKGLEKGSDPLNLSDALYRKHPRAWHKLTQDGKLPLSPELLESVEVQVEISNSGKISLTPF